MNIRKLFGAFKKRERKTSIDDNRPIMFIPEGKNIWRIVYAD